MALPTARVRIRLCQGDVHYAGGRVAGAKVVEIFGDLATELCIAHDGSEGLLRAYSELEFLAPLRAGDYLEASGRMLRVGRSSRTCEFDARKVIAAGPNRGGSAASVLDVPIAVARGVGTVVIASATDRGVAA